MLTVRLGDAVETGDRHVQADAQACERELLAIDDFSQEGRLGTEHQYGVQGCGEGRGVGLGQPPEALGAKADLAREGIGRIGWIEEAERGGTDR